MVRKALHILAGTSDPAPLHFWLTNRKNIPTAINSTIQNTDDQRSYPMPTLDGLRSSGFLRRSDPQPEEKVAHPRLQSNSQVTVFPMASINGAVW
jgi:hypothetical protein